MGSSTGIAWTDCTWNPVRGCSRISEGCRNCYAERIAARMATNPKVPGMAGFAEMTQAGPNWTGRVELVPSKLEEPLRWRRPRRVFVNSMSDLFHEGMSDRDIGAVFGVMAACPHLTFQILTKRADRMLSWMTEASARVPHRWWMEESLRSLAWSEKDLSRLVPERPWPLPNVWLGVSAEGQETLRKRAWQLLKTPSAVRFVSLEPLLEKVDLDRPELLCGTWRRGATIGTYLDWVIVGGESGPGARPFDVSWARVVVEQCRRSLTPVFVKQLGANPVGESWAVNRKFSPLTRSRSGDDPAEWPEDLRIREFPRGVA